MNSQMERGTGPGLGERHTASSECRSFCPRGAGGVTQLMYQCVHPTWELSEAHTIRIFMEASSPGIAVVQLPSRVRLSATPWTAACQSSLSATIFQSLFKLISIESVMPSNRLILCRLLLLLPSIFPSFGVFSSSLHQVAKVLELQLQHQSFQ